MKVLHVVGARPNFVKVAPVIEALDRRLPRGSQVVVQTGQHYDPELSQFFVDELGFPEVKYNLRIGPGRSGQQMARVLERLEPILTMERPDVVVVAGDVTSTLAAALAASGLGLPIAHIEAGLRSFDRRMPEEINRVLTDQVSTWCFTHSPEAAENLLREGIQSGRIHFVGNTMIDTLVRLRPRAQDSDIHKRLGLQPGRYVLVTLHRPAIVDGDLLEDAIDALARLANHMPVVFPLHPRTRSRLAGKRDVGDLLLIDALGYLDFLALESCATAVITDSGGVQEETTFLGVPCFTLRTSTERPITVAQGTNQILGLEVERIDEVLGLLDDVRIPPGRLDGWDGRAAERLADVLLGEQGIPISGRRAGASV